VAERAPYDAVIAFPAMRIGVRTAGDALTGISYLPLDTALQPPRNRLAERAARQLDRYAADPDYAFDLPLARAGTPFQQRVWRAIGAIPRGKLRSYGALAHELRSAPRAVGQACGSNPYPLVVPCHRVVAARGLGGFAHHAAGFHLEVKRWLLGHEGCPVAREPAS
jgi:methylated-DNA-[protein]-cysteine S-methyltransferase